MPRFVVWVEVEIDAASAADAELEVQTHLDLLELGPTETAQVVEVQPLSSGTSVNSQLVVPFDAVVRTPHDGDPHSAHSHPAAGKVQSPQV
jgi:hypothetical protein